jgi:hypothetical protein
MPGFVKASAADPNWIDQLAAVERLLYAIDRKADDDPATIEIFDKILAVIGRSDPGYRYASSSGSVHVGRTRPAMKRRPKTTPLLTPGFSRPPRWQWPAPLINR